MFKGYVTKTLGCPSDTGAGSNSGLVLGGMTPVERAIEYAANKSILETRGEATPAKSIMHLCS